MRVGEAAHPGPGSDAELLDCLQQDLMSGMRIRRVRRRVLDSDSDAPVDVAELSAGEQSVPRETRGRRLVLVSSTQVDSMVSTVPDSTHAVQAGADEDVEPVGESDTESNRSVSVAGGDADVADEGSEVEPHNSLIGDEEAKAASSGPTPRFAVTRRALEMLDEVNVKMLFSQRASVMKNVPKCIVGPYRNAMRLALEEVSGFAGTKSDWKEVGNSSCCFPECCCTGHREVV